MASPEPGREQQVFWGMEQMPATRKLAFGLLAALLLLGCQLVTGLQGQGGTPGASLGVKREDSLFLTGGQPRTLDPATTLAGPDSPTGYLFDGLVALDSQLHLEPRLAAGWQVDGQGTRYTFYLRPEAVFHNGRPVTADDVLFSWERAADPATGSDTVLTYLGDIVGLAEKRQGRAQSIAGLEKLDDHTLRVTIDAPKVTFLAKLTMPVGAVVDRENVAQPDWEHAPNGTGPFRLASWQDDEMMVLARNEQYYLSPPALAHVVLLLGPGLPLSMYETGQIDLVGVGGSDLDRLLDPNNPLSAELQTGPRLCTIYAGFNTRRPPFDDVRLRRAFSLALDREKLVDALFQGQALPAKGPLPPGMPGYSALPGLPYDPGLARRLLAEAGYQDPAGLPPLTFSTAGYNDAGTLVTTLITRWQQALGVTITPILHDPYTYPDNLYAGDIGNLYTSSWCADYPDPENFLDVLYYSRSTQNFSGFADAGIDAALEAARLDPDSDQRMARYAQIEQAVIEQAPALFLAHPTAAVLVKPRVQGFHLTPLGVPQWQLLSLDN